MPLSAFKTTQSEPRPLTNLMLRVGTLGMYPLQSVPILFDPFEPFPGARGRSVFQPNPVGVPATLYQLQDPFVVNLTRGVGFATVGHLGDL